MIPLRSMVAATISSLLLLTAAPATPAETSTPPESRAITSIQPTPFEFGQVIPLDVESSGVEWKGHTYHLLRLNSVRFDLDRQASLLRAEVKAGVTTFDDVSYDISAAVFDSAGQLLGTARTAYKVERLWLGTVLMSAQTINLDFGASLDYERANSFVIAISKRKVLTPDAWQK